MAITRTRTWLRIEGGYDTNVVHGKQAHVLVTDEAGSVLLDEKAENEGVFVFQVEGGYVGQVHVEVSGAKGSMDDGWIVVR